MALLVPGSQQYVDAVLSLLARGIVPIPLDPRLTAYERDRILADLEPDLVVTDEGALGGPDHRRRTPPGPADARHQRHHRHTQGRLQRRAGGS